MCRRVDDLGRIVLPVELRRLHGIRTGDSLEISVDGGAIVLRKLEAGCIFCDGVVDLADFRGRRVCRPCALAVHPGEVPRPEMLPSLDAETSGAGAGPPA